MKTNFAVGGASMNLYSVTFTARVYNGRTAVPYHEVILNADTEDDAESKARDWFLHGDGRGWTQVDPLERSAEPIIRNIKITPLSLLLIRNKTLISRVEG